MTYILYNYWRSSCSWRVRLALNLKGIPYEYQSVHLARDGGEQHGEAFRRLNPMGQVPALHDVANDRILTQSLVIIDYLEMQHPEPALYPADPFQALAARALCEQINSGIQPLQNLSVLQQLSSRFGADETGRAQWAAHFIEQGFSALETQIARTAGRYSFGDQLTALDCCLIPQVYGAHRFGADMSRFPTLSRIDAACRELEVFQKADPAAQSDAV